MKKRIALLMAAMIAVCSVGTVSFAEETETATEAVELNWSDIKDDVEQLDFKGDFVHFDDVAFKMWIPEHLKEVELTDEEKAEGFIGYFTTEDDAKAQAAVSVVYVDLGGMDLEQYAEELAKTEGVSEIEAGYVNGLPCVSYEIKDQDSGSITFMTEAGYGLEVTCAPISSDEAKEIFVFIISSIMPEEEAETEESK